MFALITIFYVFAVGRQGIIISLVISMLNAIIIIPLTVAEYVAHPLLNAYRGCNELEYQPKMNHSLRQYKCLTTAALSGSQNL